ncbi:MAG: N-acetylmuramoyl-L-alanine amidase [Bacteroidales bacterium]
MKTLITCLTFLLLSGCAVNKEYYPKVGGIRVNHRKHKAKGNYNDRINTLVLHYTVSDYPSSIITLTERNVSSHYLVGDDDTKNKVLQLVGEDKRAWHAGKSHWNGTRDLNSTSIGIEIVNPGYKDINEERTYFPFSDEQIRKVGLLSKSIVERYNIKPLNIVGHQDIAPDRKSDPGPLFPWLTLYTDYSVGAWPDKKDVEMGLREYQQLIDMGTNESEIIKLIQQGLKKIGYDLDDDGMLGKNTKDAIVAFQTHYRQSKYDGKIDAETFAIISALIKKYR